MGLLWPGFLLLLGLIPLLVMGYIWILRRRRRFAVRFSSLVFVRQATPQQSRLRRYLSSALFLLALASLVVALSRPFASVRVPAGQATIILAIDVSRSMCSTDIQPNRLEAAKDAALSFIKSRSTSTQIGIVAFAGFAALTQPPTTDQEVLQDAVEDLTTARRTAIGSAILKSVDAIAEINQSIAPSGSAPDSTVQPDPLAPAEYAPDIIVLLTDGVTNSGPEPLQAAQQAVDRGIRVYTIGFGTENGSFMDCGDQFWWGGFSSGYQGSPYGGFRRGIDETTLKEIAEMTGGAYYSATSAGELQNVFERLPTHLITREETTELSVAFTVFGALLATLAFLFSMLWHPLP